MQVFKLLLPLLFFAAHLGAQNADPKLAQQYFQNGEYEKAGALFEKLFKKNNENDYYFNQYIECLIYQEAFSKCEKIVKNQIKKKPDQIELYVTYGNLFERQYKDEKAKEQYQKAIKKLPADRFPITKLANAFTRLQKYDLAIQTYEKGAKQLKNKYLFAYNLGDLYRRKGDTPKMIESYLNSLNDNPSRLNTMKTLFQRYLLEEDYFELQSQLYVRIQEDEDATHFPELLTWVFIHNKDYPSAFRQVKALDRQMDENGGRIFRLAEIAANDRDYDTAIKAYDYIIKEKGFSSTFYIEAKRASLSCKRNQLTGGYDYTETELRDLELQYNQFLEEFGRNKITAVIIAELADLEAFYLNDLDKAIALLLEMIDYPGLKPAVKAEGKISLADFYLMKGEVWEATLLYSQVDKAFKDDILGHQARFRNAKLSYYTGDFQWAQTQFDVLKASTSKLIANDALDLSIFILDNLGLDTSAAALTLYSEADLLVFQNRFEEAFAKLDTIKNDFPKHSLEDDIYYTKSTIYYKKREYEKSAEMLQKIVDDYSDGIRVDNALFKLAELYENQLNDIERAKGLYEKIFIEFSGSTFAVEARKRYRRLRGDDV
ncbi:MAG: tetratricopeptide repeat protein [Bacteroidota bacterium]